jgi:hypothetical protein
MSSNVVSNLVHALLLVLFGGALIFGARGAARFLNSLGYDPDSVPAQQFSLRVILSIVVGCAVVLGVIRLLVQ